MIWSWQWARHSTGESADTYDTQSPLVQWDSQHPPVIAAAHSTNVPERKIPWESTTTLIPRGTNTGYSLRVPRWTGKGGGRGRRCWLLGNTQGTLTVRAVIQLLAQATNKLGGPLQLPSNIAACRPGTKTFQGREVSMAAWRQNVLPYSCQRGAEPPR